MKLIDEQKDFLSKLIAIKSVSGTPEETDGLPGTPYGSNPKSALSFFLKEAKDKGFATGDLDDRVGWCEIGSGKKMVGIVCHLDVVPAGDGWNTDPFKLCTDNDVLTGRGIVDDKGPAAAAFFAMQDIIKENSNLDFRIRLILGTDEERTCSCVEHYDRHGEMPDIAITPDAEFPVIYAEKGILHVRITGKLPGNKGGEVSARGGDAANMVCPSLKMTVRENGEINIKGKTAHASRPELGVNAIDMLPGELKRRDIDLNDYPIIKYIEEFNRRKSELCDIEDDSGKMTSNHGIFRIECEDCILVTDIRYPVTADKDIIFKKIEELAESLGLKAEIKNNMDPVYKDKDSEEIKVLTKIWTRHMPDFTGYKEEYSHIYDRPVAIGGGTYARHMRNTIAFGIQTPWSEDQCHQVNESLSLNDFENLIDVIKDACLELGRSIR